MVDLRRWIRKTAPHHLALAGILTAGLAGCQSAQTVESPLDPVESQAIEPVPAPVPPYDELPVLPVPSAGVDAAESGVATESDEATAVTKTDRVPAPSEPEFEDEPKFTETESAVEPGSAGAEKPAVTDLVPVKPESGGETTPESGPTATVQSETAQPEPEGETGSVEAETPAVTSPAATSEEGVAATTAAPTLPLEPATPGEPVESLFPDPLPETVAEDRVPNSTAPTLPGLDTKPKAVTVEPVPETPETQAATENDPLTVPGNSVPGETAPEAIPPFLPESLPESKDPVSSAAESSSAPESSELKSSEPVFSEPETAPTGTVQPNPTTTEIPEDTANIRRLESELSPFEPPTPDDKPLPFGDTGEEAIPVPQRPAPSEAVKSDEASLLPEFEEDSRKGKAATGKPFIELPEITPGPAQPAPEETPIPTAGRTVLRDDRLASRDVGRSPYGPVPEPQETRTQVRNETVRAVEIASFGGTADGIVFDVDGTAFVSHRDSISRVTLDGEVSHWAKTGAPRGHAILRDGTHLICDASQRTILQLDADGTLLRKVAAKSDGYFLRSPDDLVVDAKGGIYFTDPGYARIRNAIGKIHYVAPDGTTAVVAQKLAYPEGLAISPDGSKLFVAESQQNRIVEFEILAPGELGPKEVFTELPGLSEGDTDNFAGGLAVDREGWLYVAHGGMSRVEVIAPDGDWRTSFSCPNTVVRNLAFSRDFSKLFVTGVDRKRRTAGRLMLIDFAGR